MRFRGDGDKVTQCFEDARLNAGNGMGRTKERKKEKRGRKGVFNFLPDETQFFHHFGDVAELQFLTKNLLFMTVPNGIC